MIKKLKDILEKNGVYSEDKISKLEGYMAEIL